MTQSSYQDYIDDNFQIEVRERLQKYHLGNAHSHNNYELYYLVTGEINYFIGENIYHIKSGDVVLIPPHIIHKTVPGTNYSHKRILSNFTADFVKEFLKYDETFLDFFECHVIPMSKRRAGRIEAVLESLLQEYNDNSHDVIMLKSLLGELLSILRRISKKTTETEGSSTISDLTSSRILDIVKYINSSYQSEITLEDLSHKFFMSPTYLSRTFKKVMGISFSRYIKSVRINHSIHLLLNTNLNVTQIAMKNGFNSSNHFCKTFKDEMSISPLKYRQIYNKSKIRS